MITVTENATNKIDELLVENEENYLRISVQGGGCSGFTYSFVFDDPADDDFTFGKVLIDSMSIQYMQGATLDYLEDLMGSQFTVLNPNAQTTCGCGSSFSV
jgi:iron-sulfur cluster insertion protein